MGVKTNTETNPACHHITAPIFGVRRFVAIFRANRKPTNLVARLTKTFGAATNPGDTDAAGILPGTGPSVWATFGPTTGSKR